MKITKMNQTRALENRIRNEYEQDLDLHAYKIDELMQNEKEALRLHLDNLVLTYGIRAVRASLKETKLSTVSKSSRMRKGA